jgi:hypothetical protein
MLCQKTIFLRQTGVFWLFFIQFDCAYWAPLEMLLQWWTVCQLVKSPKEDKPYAMGP